MITKKHIAAIDIGSSNIVVAHAIIDRRGKILSLDISESKSRGLRKGLITDLEKLTDSIQSAARALKAKSKAKIHDVYININGSCITTRHSKAAIPLADRANRVVNQSDIRKINEQARLLGLKLEEEVVHEFPQSYSVDDNNKVDNPIGLHARKLEIDSYLVVSRIDHINNLVKSVHQSGLQVSDIQFSGLADSVAVLHPREKQNGCMLMNIGAGLTEILIFKGGILRQIEVMPFGGNDITEAIASKLKLPFELAEGLKKSYGLACSSDVEAQKEVLIKHNTGYKPLKQKLICELVESKIGEFISLLKERIDNLDLLEKINSGLVITGGTVLLPGLLERIESELDLPVKLGRIKNVTFSSGKMPLYSTVVGLIYCGIDISLNRRSKVATSRNFLARFLDKIKDVYQEYF